MEKLTDNEIIERFTKTYEQYKEKGDFRTTVYGEILDLINRQKAEVERLQKIIVGFMDEVGTWSNKYDVDVSNIHKLPILAKEDWNIRNNIKSEAINTFAEKLKECFPSIADAIDYTVEELLKI